MSEFFENVQAIENNIERMRQKLALCEERLADIASMYSDEKSSFEYTAIAYEMRCMALATIRELKS